MLGEYAPELEITGWDPPRRFAYRSGQAPDGRFIAYEFLVEGRAGGSTVLRTVTSGFIPGDDWAEEFEAMRLGGELYFRTLVEYLAHFAGRFAVPVTAFGPPGTQWARDRELLYRALGLTGSAARGDLVRFAADDIGPVDGVVYFANAHTIGVRTHGCALPVPARLRQARHGRPSSCSPRRCDPEPPPRRPGNSWLSRTLA